MRNFATCTPHKIYDSVVLIKKSGMCDTYSTYDEKMTCLQGFGGKTERDHLEDLDVNERIVLKLIFDRFGERRELN